MAETMVPASSRSNAWSVHPPVLRGQHQEQAEGKHWSGPVWTGQLLLMFVSQVTSLFVCNCFDCLSSWDYDMMSSSFLQPFIMIITDDLIIFTGWFRSDLWVWKGQVPVYVWYQNSKEGLLSCSWFWGGHDHLGWPRVQGLWPAQLHQWRRSTASRRRSGEVQWWTCDQAARSSHLRSIHAPVRMFHRGSTNLENQSLVSDLKLWHQQRLQWVSPMWRRQCFPPQQPSCSWNDSCNVPAGSELSSSTS